VDAPAAAATAGAVGGGVLEHAATHSAMSGARLPRIGVVAS
jgi:hypothetical protein